MMHALIISKCEKKIQDFGHITEEEAEEEAEEEEAEEAEVEEARAPLLSVAFQQTRTRTEPFQGNKRELARFNKLARFKHRSIYNPSPSSTSCSSGRWMGRSSGQSGRTSVYLMFIIYNTR